MKTIIRFAIVAIAIWLASCAARKPLPYRTVFSKTKPAPDCVPFQERDGAPEWVCPNPDYPGRK
jgi:hypothetical protein